MALFGKSDTTSRALIRNGTDNPLLLIFEPWCWTHELAPGAQVVCEATSPRPGLLEVEYTKDSVTVHAWDACVGRVLDPRGVLIESLDIRVPDFIGLDEERAKKAR